MFCTHSGAAEVCPVNARSMQPILTFAQAKIDMRYFIVFLSLAGLIVATLALRVHYNTGTEPCSINEHWDCGIVNHSSYSVIDHVPVAAIGMAGYLLMGILALARRRILLLIAAILGLVFALHLSSIERNVLEVWCLYCVISQGIIALITLMSLGWLIAAERAKSLARKANS
jgi:vitamin-K-epoxide reductase (warfarin-sensitive)